MTEPKPVAVRLDSELVSLLEKLVKYDHARLIEMGLEHGCNASTVVRRLIRQEAKRVGIDTSSPVDPRQLEIPTPATKKKASK